MARTLEVWSRRLKPARLRGGVLPRLWVVSDPLRLPDPRPAMRRLPRGAGVLARGLAPGLLRAVAGLARRRGLVLMVGGDGRAALSVRAGLHLPDREGVPGLLPFLAMRRGAAAWALLSVAVHGRRAVARGRRVGADFAFASPAFPTASHPGAPALGVQRWSALSRRAGRPAVALGGVAAGNAGRLPRGRMGARGLAAIGSLARNG